MSFVFRRNGLAAQIALWACLAALATSRGVYGAAIEDAVSPAARPLALSAVELTGGPLKQAQDVTEKYLLTLEPDRMMAGYRIRAGLEPKAEGYGGWDSVDGRQLTGHIAGHYLSGISLMYAVTGNEEFKRRVDYIVDEMKEVQDARGTGYLGAVADRDGTDAAELFEQQVAKGDIRSGGFDLNGMWSPWYTLHKTFAGLRDAYRHADNETALELEVKFAEWVENVLQDLSDEQIQQMLDTEFGGMNEVLADLYADTGDERWLKLSYKFEHDDVVGPLQEGRDILAGKHGNTQVPKLIGSIDRYRYAGNPQDFRAAQFFWERVVNHHSFATGGHGTDEYFGRPDRLSDRVNGRTAETCNIYNMLKLTRRLFAMDPNVDYAEFHDRALFNHILGSIDPETGATCYMVPVGQGVQREYADLYRSFTCCVGTGLESHALHGHGIYYEADDHLWVNLYAPSVATWKEAGVTLTMETNFPEGELATATISAEAPKTFTLSLRRPSWAGDGFEVRVNGEVVHDLPEPGSYVDLTREWRDGDEIELTLPKVLHLEPLPDNEQRVAIMWGPLVLAGDLGEERRRRGRGRRSAEPEEIPVFVAANEPVDEWVEPKSDEPGEFATDGVGRERDVDLIPFYRLHHRVYGAYWDLFTPQQWEERAAEIAAERERLRILEEATVAYAQPGEMQPERNYNFQGEEAWPVRESGRPGRVGRDWFSFDIPVDDSQPMALVVTYHSSERRRKPQFRILIDGELLAEESLEEQSPARFYDKEYPLPKELVEGKEKVTIRFETTEGNGIGPVFGLRMIHREESLND